MITHTTNLDNNAYASLFEEINLASQKRRSEDGSKLLKIENLEQFFGNIQEIAALDKKFLRLPLDEPMLEINANTRKINIDDTDFKVNGIAVQGDHLAETVFFKIDRYFDFMDLMNTDIYINWKIGSESGRDKCFIKSDTIIPGYIVFGWSISNHITGKSGVLNFAVELEVRHDDGQKYSLNTLAANVAVKDGLILTNPELYDMSSNISAILSNSSFGEGTAAVEEVKWISGGGNGLVKDLSKDFSPIISLDAEYDEDNGQCYSVPARLYALAAAGRDASILYSDKSKKLQDTVFIEVPTGITLSEDVVYYVKEESLDAVPAYNIASLAALRAWGTEDEIPLYVAVVEVIADGVGEYYVHAQGVKYNEQLDEKGDIVEVKIGASALKESAKVIVPWPEAPSSINIATVENPIVEKYSFTDKAKDIVYLVGSDGISIAASADFEKDFGLLSFKWMKDGVELANQTNSFSKESSSVCVVTEPGEYSVQVTHYQNGEFIPTISDTRLVSALASPVKLEPIKSVNMKAVEGRLNQIKVPYALDYVSHANNTPTFDCTLELVVYNEEGTEIESIQTVEMESHTVEEQNIICKVLAKKIPDDGGLYRIRVAHSYNESIYTTETNEFNINIS